jgi:hypothetical protein
MRVVSNERRIKRNARIGQIATYTGLIVLAGGLVINLRYPEQIALSWGALLVGIVVSQVGMAMNNRWGRSPRPDEEISKALKGLTQDYTLYHYVTPAHHVLIGPAGVWVLAAYPQKGEITYENGRWRHKSAGRGFFLRKLFGQEGLGRPDLEIGSEIESLDKYLQKSLPDGESPPVQAALVFTSSEVHLDADKAPVPSLPAKKLKPFLQKQAKENRFPKEKASQIDEIIDA